MASEPKELGRSGMVKTNKEDDDDLEALRLAALLSRKSAQEGTNGQGPTVPSHGTSTSLPFNKKPFHQENHRNNFGSSNKWSRQRSSNLIVINPVPLNETKPESCRKETPPKLILPQDKWCPPTPPVNTQKVIPDSSGPGKFSRIRCQSDDSESEDSDSESGDSNSEAEGHKLGTGYSEGSTSDDLTAEAENESSSDFLVTQEHDSLDDTTSQPISQNVNHFKGPVKTSTECAMENTDSVSSAESSNSDVDENVENVSKVCSVVSKDERTSDRTQKERKSENASKASQRQPPSTKLLDLREVLKAKRDVKNNSDYDSDDDRPNSPVSSSLKSVLSVVKRSGMETNDLNKKLSSRLPEDRAKSKTKERPVGRSVFLTLEQPNKRTDKVSPDGSQEEKKCSVHMRLGVKNNSRSPPKSKVPVTSRLGLAVQQQQSQDSDDDQLSTENFVRDQSRGNRRRRRRRSQSSTRNKRSRHSGFRGSKESERDAKIRRIEKINTVRR